MDLHILTTRNFVVGALVWIIVLALIAGVILWTRPAMTADGSSPSAGAAASAQGQTSRLYLPAVFNAPQLELKE